MGSVAPVARGVGSLCVHYFGAVTVR